MLPSLSSLNCNVVKAKLLKMARFLAREMNKHGFLIMKRLFGDVRIFRENLESVNEEYIESAV